MAAEMSDDELAAFTASANLEELKAAYVWNRQSLTEADEVSGQLQNASAKMVEEWAAAYGVQSLYDLDDLMTERREHFEKRLERVAAAMEVREKGSVEKFRKEQGIYDEKKWY